MITKLSVISYKVKHRLTCTRTDFYLREWIFRRLSVRIGVPDVVEQVGGGDLADGFDVEGVDDVGPEKRIDW